MTDYEVRIDIRATRDRAFPLRVTTFEPGKRRVWDGVTPLGLISKSMSDLDPSSRRFAPGQKALAETGGP